jgi:hypothetical protein
VKSRAFNARCIFCARLLPAPGIRRHRPTRPGRATRRLPQPAPPPSAREAAPRGQPTPEASNCLTAKGRGKGPPQRGIIPDGLDIGKETPGRVVAHHYLVAQPFDQRIDDPSIHRRHPVDPAGRQVRGQHRHRNQPPSQAARPAIAPHRIAAAHLPWIMHQLYILYTLQSDRPRNPEGSRTGTLPADGADPDASPRRPRVPDHSAPFSDRRLCRV